MFERQTIDGRLATVAYLNDSFEPVDNRDEATVVKVMFDDGDELFLVPQGREGVEAASL